MATNRPRLGFVGMGGMGSRMAGRLLAAGYDLTVYKRTRARTRRLEQRGAKMAATPRDLSAAVDIVLSSVADDAAVENVMYGSDGVLAGARSSKGASALGAYPPAFPLRLMEELAKV